LVSPVVSRTQKNPPIAAILGLLLLFAIIRSGRL
jgi:hypothetical protein